MNWNIDWEKKYEETFDYCEKCDIDVTDCPGIDYRKEIDKMNQRIEEFTFGIGVKKPKTDQTISWSTNFDDLPF